MTEQSKKNAKALGVGISKFQTIEECGELIKAICKYNRAIGIGQITPITRDEALENLITEIADVSICVEQLAYLMGIEEQVECARQIAFDKVSARYHVEETKK